MINELYAASTGLKNNKISVQKGHQNIYPCSKKDGLIVKIDKDGNPVESITIKKDIFCTYWALRKGNHNSWPTINITKPLLKLDQQVVKEITKDPKKIKFYLSLDYMSKDLKLIHTSDWTIENLKGINIPQIDLLLERYPTKENYIDFFEKLIKIIINQNVEEDKTLINLLSGKIDKNNIKSDVPIYFDIDDDNIISVHSQKTKDDVINFLLKKSSNIESQDESICYLTGEKGPIEEDKFPDPSTCLGKTFIFSKNSNCPCNERYGHSGPSSYQMNKEICKDIQDTLTYLTSKKNEQITWCKVPSHIPKSSDLLIAYIEDKLHLNIPVSCPFGIEDKSGVYEEKTKSVIDNLEKQIDTNESHVKLLIIGSIDKGRKQLKRDSKISVKDLINRSYDWINGSKNLPHILLSFEESKNKKISIKPFPWSPARCVSCLSSILSMQKDKKKEKKPKGAYRISYSDMLDLYIGNNRESKRCAKKIITHISQRYMNKILGHYSEQVKNSYKNTKKENVYNILGILFCLGIALSKENSKKEIYMKQDYYKIGMLLNLVNNLHKNYCQVVRDNKLVPLIGTTLFSVAINDPVKALSMLSTRIVPYKSWAERYRGDKAKYLGWTLSKLNKVSSDIDVSNIPRKVNDEQKAIMLLGFLSSGQQINSIYPKEESHE